MPQMEAMDWEAHGRIARYGGFIATVQQFIKGCRAAAEANEPLTFE
jgi:hypothetical protein